MIQADYYLRSGDCRRAMVIGAETLSRVSDPHDRDSMIYADGAGAMMLEAHATASGRRHSLPRGPVRHPGASLGTAVDGAILQSPARETIACTSRWRARKLYEYALNTVPLASCESLEKAGLTLGDVGQGADPPGQREDGRGDPEAALQAVRQPGAFPRDIMPMTMSWLGNSSVATVPTLLDLLTKGQLEGHALNSGDRRRVASVGAGMNINSVIYKIV